jgi:hypothetical protein
MKKFPKIKKMDASKLKAMKVSKENLFNVKGGMRPITICTYSMCSMDGVEEGDC